MIKLIKFNSSITLKKSNIIYVGNDLEQKTKYRTAMQILSDFLVKEGYQVTKTSNQLNKGLRLLDMIFCVLKNTKNANIILIDTYSTTNFYYALVISVLARLLKNPYIPILHGGNLPKRLKTNKWLCKMIFANSLINVSPSNYLHQEFTKSNFKVIVVPNAIDLDLYKFKKRERFIPKLLYVRALANIYNPLMAIKTVAILQKEYPNISLSMVGPDRDGILSSLKTEVSRLKLENNIQFVGILTPSEWHKMSEQHDIFINTTNFDNLPISIIEAMALGFPIVSTNVGGLGQLIDHNKNGILIPKNDALAMANAIRDIIEGKHPNLSFEARKKSESFTWETIRNDWINILEI